MEGSDSEDEDFIAQQAALAQAKFAGKMPQKSPLIQAEQKKFDSADYQMQMEKMKQTAGISSHGAAAMEEEKKEE